MCHAMVTTTCRGKIDAMPFAVGLGAPSEGSRGNTEVRGAESEVGPRLGPPLGAYLDVPLEAPWWLSVRDTRQRHERAQYSRYHT